MPAPTTAVPQPGLFMDTRPKPAHVTVVLWERPKEIHWIHDIRERRPESFMNNAGYAQNSVFSSTRSSSARRNVEPLFNPGVRRNCAIPAFFASSPKS